MDKRIEEKQEDFDQTKVYVHHSKARGIFG